MVAILLLLVLAYAVMSVTRQPPPNEQTRWYRVPTYQRQKRRSERWMIVRVDEGEAPPPNGVLVGRGVKP